MRLLIADLLPEVHVARLRELGHDCAYDPELTGADVAMAALDRDAIVVRSTRVTRDMLEAAPDVRLVIRAGSGTDTIDVEAAVQHGVAVSNVPGRNAVAVAELAFGLLLALDRRIPDAVSDLREGRWRKRHYQRARGIAGRHVGVVGLGSIGLEFASRAVAFDCHVHAVERTDRDPGTRARAERIGITFVPDLETLASICDVLSFHVPLAPATRGLIGRPLLDHVADGTLLINTSRGELIDEDALLEALDTKDLRLGLDVFPEEPGAPDAAFDSRLARHPNVYGTHHVGASTAQAQEAIATEVVDMIEAYARGELRHCVNEARLATVRR